MKLTHKKVMAFAIGFSALLMAAVLIAIALSGAWKPHSFALYLVKDLDTAAARATALDELPLEEQTAKLTEAQAVLQAVLNNEPGVSQLGIPGMGR